MSLRLIYGRSGTGKSEYCYKDICSRILKEEKIYIITPEQFSFTAEQKLLENLETESVINAEVLTFNRMAYRILNEIYGKIQTNITQSGKSMLVYYLLTHSAEKLNFLSNSNQNTDLVLTQISEFKKHNVTVNILDVVLNNIEDTYLHSKINDLKQVYGEYEMFIKDKYIDEDDVLTKLNENILQSDMLKNSVIYIDEFAGFTTQEYELIKKLLISSKQVNITICLDKLEEAKNKDTDIFYDNKITYEKLMKCAKETKILIDKPIEQAVIYRLKNDELKHLEKNMYEVPYKKYDNVIKNISMFLALNPYSEVENIGNDIEKLVREEGYRYKDISIITKNIDNYSNIIKAVFDRYGIPVFIDEKKSLNNNILIKYILALLEVLNTNFSYDAIFNYLKSGFLEIENEDIYAIEKYCLKWGIKGKKWYEKDWEFDRDNENKNVIDRLNELRRKIVIPLLELKESIKNNKTAREITEKLYQFLDKNGIESILENKAKKLEMFGEIDLANEYKNSFKVLIDLFDELTEVFKDTKLNFNQYKEILKVGLENDGLGKIPATIDSVIVGDIDRSRSRKSRAVFIIGLNDGIFPNSNKNEGFLNDNERDKLKTKGIELAKNLKEKLYEEQFNIYKAFTIGEERLCLSYASSDKDGKSLRPSILVSKINKMFTKLVTKSDIINKEMPILNENITYDELLLNLKKYQDGENIDERWFDIYCWYKNNENWKTKLYRDLEGLNFTNIPPQITSKNIDKLYGDTLNTTVSRLEQYQRCAFSFFLKYGLKLKENEELKVKPIDTGSFMHEVIEDFFAQISDEKIEIKEIEEEQIKQIVYGIIEKKLSLPKNYIFTSNAKFIALTNRLKKIITQAITYIVYQLKNSSFYIKGNEVEFKNGKEYKPINIELEDGKKIEITGKIDRIDIDKIDGKEYIRIVDYKSSEKSIDLNEVVSGLQIQLLTYLDSVTSREESAQAGILYFNLLDPIIKSNKNMNEEEIENEIKKKFRMNGLILADLKVIKHMDNSLQQGSSNNIPVSLNKDGEIIESRSSTISKENFDNLQQYINKLIKKIGTQLLNGNIDINPYYKKNTTACAYCQYKQICNFNTKIEGNNYKYISDLKKQEILDKLKKGEI